VFFAGIVPQVVSAAFEAAEWTVGVGIYAELHYSLLLRATVSGVPQRYRQVFSVDLGDVVGLLYHKASVYPPPQIRHIQGVDTSTLDHNRRTLNDQTFTSGI